MSNPPAGFYDDGSGRRRWWDGSEWTNHYPGDSDTAETATEPPKKVNLPAHKRFVTVGSQSDIFFDDQDVTEADAAKFALLEPFDASIVPTLTGLVPADCVWSCVPWPGPLPEGATTGNLKARIQNMGPVRGRRISEFENALGTPTARAVHDHGLQAVSWSHGSLFGGVWSVNYLFDRYGVCAGIRSQVGI